MKTSQEREKRRQQILDETLSSAEVLEILGFSRMRLSQIVNAGRLTPIRNGLYLKDDIYAFMKDREEIMKEHYKQRGIQNGKSNDND